MPFRHLPNAPRRRRSGWGTMSRFEVVVLVLLMVGIMGMAVMNLVHELAQYVYQHSSPGPLSGH